jgi:hypothetical protein
MELFFMLLIPAVLGALASSAPDDTEPDAEETSQVLSLQSAKTMLNEIAAEDGAANDDIWWGDMVRTDGTEADETLTGGAANDLIFGGGGNDLITYGDGGNLSWADPWSHPALFEQAFDGDDTLIGGAEQDILWDVEGANEMLGGGGNDILVAMDDLRLDTDQPEANLELGELPATPDQLFGGSGDDTFDADKGDTVTGGAGNDRFWTWHNQADAQPVEITDFSAGDTILLQVTPNLISDEDFDANPWPDLITDPETGDVTVTHSGITLVVLKGPIALDPSQISLSVYHG